MGKSNLRDSRFLVETKAPKQGPGRSRGGPALAESAPSARPPRRGQTGGGGPVREAHPDSGGAPGEKGVTGKRSPLKLWRQHPFLDNRIENRTETNTDAEELDTVRQQDVAGIPRTRPAGRTLSAPVGPGPRRTASWAGEPANVTSLESVSPLTTRASWEPITGSSRKVYRKSKYSEIYF